MRTYSEEEKTVARTSLPQPLREFLESSEVGTIFAGLGKHSRLNIRQADVAFRLVEATFLGLEPESEFELGLRKELPELDQQTFEELLTSINEKIFSEAKRRLLAFQKDSAEPPKGAGEQ